VGGVSSVTRGQKKWHKLFYREGTKAGVRKKKGKIAVHLTGRERRPFFPS